MADNEDEVDLPLSNHKNNSDLDSELQEENYDNRNGLPIDHGWAWMTVVGCFGVCALVVGSLKSFGVLLVDLSKRLDAPTSVIVITQSVAGFFHLALAPLANALGNRFSHRVVVFIGGVFTGVGLIATAFVTSVGWLVVTYGVIAGIGFGLTLGPSLVCMGLHFSERRAFANGLSSAGAGAGSFALPNLMRFLLFQYGFNGCLLILGGVVLNTCAFACLFRPKSFWMRSFKLKTNNSDKQDSKNSVNGKLNSTTRYNFEIVHSSTGRIDIYSEKKHSHEEKYFSHPNINLQISNSSYKSQNSRNTNFSNSSLLFTSMESLCVLPSNHKPVAEREQKSSFISKCQGHLDWSILKDPVFIVINSSIWFGIFGHHLVFNCLPSLCEELGMSDTDGAVVVSIVGISDFVGRLSAGWFADLKILQRKTVFQLSLGLFSVFMFILPHVNSLVGVCIISSLTGIATGGYIGIQVSVLADAFGIENLSNSLGFVFLFASISLLTSPFVAGLTKDASGSWTQAIRLGASAGLLGALLIFLVPLAKRISMVSKAKTFRLKKKNPETISFHIDK